MVRHIFPFIEKTPSESVDMVLTDIPYLVSKQTNFETIKNHTKKSGITEYSCMDFGNWDYDFDVNRYITECCRILKKSRSIIVWAAWQQLQEVDNCIRSYLKKNCGSSRIGIWEKTNPSVFNMQRMAIQPFEFFIWNRKGKKWVFNNLNLPKPERHLFRHACLAGGHPTAKPVSIFEHLIRTYTNEGQVVFDGLVGGGTTAVACIRTNRRFICCEADQHSYEMALEAVNSI